MPQSHHAPGLAIYLPTDASMGVDGTGITITIGEIEITVPYVGKTLVEIASQVGASSESVDAVPLNRSGPLEAGALFLSDSTDTTIDGGEIIRIRSHAIRYTEDTKIRVLPPYAENRLLPWYPRVDRGSVFIKRYGVKFLFSVPEYAEQEWSTIFGKPYVDQVDARAEFIAPKLLRLARTPIHWVHHNLGLTVNGQPTGAGIIQDVDVHNGFVKLSAEMAASDTIRATYTHREDTLVYKGVNLNPSIEHNPGIIDQAVVIYLKPTYSSNGQKRTQTVHHIVSRTLTGALTSIPATTEPVLVIGAFYVRPSGVVTDVKLTDTRTRGGGIEQKDWDAALAKNREFYSVSDFGRYDGVPFPAAASGVLFLPRSILERFDADFVERQVSRHVAAGGHILIEYAEPGTEHDFDLADFDSGDFV